MIDNAGYILKKLLRTLDSVRSVAERAPGHSPDHMLSSFAMISGIAGGAIEFIEDQTDLTLAAAEADVASPL
jgi:hypothetical protein